ncbi:MAG: IclR family transcriptional regulator [Alphaproteobacteria bacterium]
MAEQRVEAVERALSILEAFSADRPALTLSEIAEETGLYKSTILRLAASLERYGYLRRGDDLRFRLGPGLWRLGTLYRKNFDLGEVIRPALRNLVRATGETGSFYVLEQDERLCLYRENSPNPMRHHLDEGARLSLKYGAAGHILEAYGLGDGDALSGLEPDGASISLGERNPGVAAMAVAVFDRRNHLHGALAISGPRDRLDEPTRLAAIGLLKQEAASLVNKL